SGEIPDCVSSLSNLRVLDLVGNSHSGQIPSQIGNLGRLVVLNLADNRTSGEIPASVSKLECLNHLELNNNQIYRRIATYFGKLKMLSLALLGRNQLAGPVPDSIRWDGEFATMFRFLDGLQRVFYDSNAVREAMVELCRLTLKVEAIFKGKTFLGNMVGASNGSFELGRMLLVGEEGRRRMISIRDFFGFGRRRKEARGGRFFCFFLIR
ncbi:unnamed protein product, partial [Linum tenue]